MPEGIEYPHCVQAALDKQGLRYQVLDTDGVVRERIEWPLPSPDPARWRELPLGEAEALFYGHVRSGRRIVLRLVGQSATTHGIGADGLYGFRARFDRFLLAWTSGS